MVAGGGWRAVETEAELARAAGGGGRGGGGRHSSTSSSSTGDTAAAGRTATPTSSPRTSMPGPGRHAPTRRHRFGGDAAWVDGDAPPPTTTWGARVEAVVALAFKTAVIDDPSGALPTTRAGGPA
uniref:Uncharacterized protein n=1 Tax=Oryza rufipogon TaxID=4529 RepID=A0A0E0P708_ORYRU